MSGSPHIVAVLARDGVMPMELGLVHQIFGAARSPEGTRLYDVRTCAVTPGEIHTNADFSIHVGNGIETLAEAATVVIPASHAADETEASGNLAPALAAAIAAIKQGTTIASICTGAYVLAAAGLLDGRKATTHWNSADDFRRRFPLIELDPGVLYVDEGDILTSAGEAAGIDLCLHLIRREHGAAVANEVARRTVVPPHREGGQAQYVTRPVPEPGISSTAAARAWAVEQLHRPVSLTELADRESMSTRTFTRRFRDEVGMSPVQWLTQQRIERARHLLEQTDLPIDRIASEAGFGTAASLRQHLNAALGVSPSAYRGTFRGGIK